MVLIIRSVGFWMSKMWVTKPASAARNMKNGNRARKKP